MHGLRWVAKYLRLEGGQLGSRLALALCCAGVAPAWGQPAAANGPNPGRAELTPTERAQRDADKVFQWIRMQGDKPVQRAQASAPAPTKPAVSPPPLVSKPTVAVAAADSSTAGADAVLPYEATLVASARIVTRTMAPLPAAPVAAAPEPELMLPLKLLTKVDPEMPRQLQANIRSGLVLVRFTVQPDGRVMAPEVVQTTNQRMSVAALEAVLQWRFAPISQARVATVEVGFNRD